MMKRKPPFCLSWLVLLAVFISCTDDLPEKKAAVDVDDSNLVVVGLSFEVAAMSSSSVATRTAGDSDDSSSDTEENERQDTKAERRIDNIWVFQFDAETKRLLITPQYYDISGMNALQDETRETVVDVQLKPRVASIVYVVANTGDSSWAKVHNSATLDDVMARTIPDPGYIVVRDGEEAEEFSLPMEGATESVTPVSGQTIDVRVTRMYAKLEITMGDIPESIVLTDVNISQIPNYCRVGTLAPADPKEAAAYPIGHTDWKSYAYSPGNKNDEGRYTGKTVVYVPENLQGRTDNGVNNPELKTESAKENALRVDFVASYVDIFTGEEKQRGRHYAVYPGANDYNDYNIRRNFVYKIKLNIYTDQYDKDIASSNCFVVKPEQQLSFLPYYRTEEGGGYEFTDYLDAEGTDETKKINDDEGDMSKNVKIIWQTKDAIGDNTNGDRVWIDHRSEAIDEFHRKIYVRTNKRGNALIAAYNSSGDIVWSWHIWVTENEPANVSNAVVYSSYAWNERGVITNVRVPGYAIMPCNLGALKYDPDDVDALDPDTHGMLFQWGRKDPFPPANTTLADDEDYTDAYTGTHYANDNTTVVGKTAGTDESKLFHSLAGTDIAGKINGDAIKYAIQHPTVFICGTKRANTTPSEGEGHVSGIANYPYQGDWSPTHDNKLWGGLDPDESGDMKSLIIRSGSQQAHIYDNYGDQKSIFDPCPSGWRVPPGDLWLGFTRTGSNPSAYSDINTDTPALPRGKQGSGMYMFMTDWQKGEKIFFPTQGTRVPDGTILRTGGCGNYHNATCDIDNRVNILHIHRDGTLFKVFEFTYLMYYVKSTGGPVRCVRDHK